MKMITKLSIMMLLIALLIAVTAIIYRDYEEEKIVQLFHNEQIDKEKNFVKLMDLKRQDIEKAVDNYTYWDDMVLFATIDQNQKWAEDNIDTMLADFSINLVWVYNVDISLIYSVHNLESDFLKKNLLPKEAISKLFKQNRFCHFYINTSKGLMDINGATIHPTNDPKRKNPPRGYFFAGRLIDKDYTTELSRLIEGKVEPVLVSDMAKSENIQGKKGAVIQFSEMLKGWDNVPLAYLKVTIESNVVPNFSRAFRDALIIFIGAVLIMIIIVLTFFFRWINNPLRLISNTLRMENPDYISKLQKSKNEFGEMAKLIAKFFEQRENLINEIADRKSTEEALKRSELEIQRREQLYHSTIESTSAVPYRRDFVTNSFEFISEGIKKLTGYPAQEFTVDLWDSIIKELVPSGKYIGLTQDEAKIKSKLEKSESFQWDVRITTASGEERWLSDSALQIRDEQGIIIKEFGILQDITERKQAEVLQERLQQTSKMESIGRLAGGVAHDFNNMLTVIQGSTSLAMMDLNQNDLLYSRLKMIEDTSDRAAGLTR
ncbi:MAG: CHASE4 domain-containing protein, partial [Candidatus Poribacteria bacterium]